MSSSRISEHFLVILDLEFFAGIGGEEHLLAHLHLQLAPFAVLGDPAVADSQDLALLRLVLGGVRQNDPAGRRLLGLFPLHHHPIAQRLEIHRPRLPR